MENPSLRLATPHRDQVGGVGGARAGLQRHQHFAPSLRRPHRPTLREAGHSLASPPMGSVPSLGTLRDLRGPDGRRARWRSAGTGRRMPQRPSGGSRSAFKPSESSARLLIRGQDRLHPPAPGRRRAHFFLSHRAGSARACSWTPSRSCSRAAKNCSAVWRSTWLELVQEPPRGAFELRRRQLRPARPVAGAWRSSLRTWSAKPGCPLPRARRRRADLPGSLRRCTASPGGASWYW